MRELKHQIIKTYLEELITHPQSASRLPTIRELMTRFEVSLAPVNRALTELEHEGKIVRRHGSGIVAREPGRRITVPEAVEKKGTVVFVYNDYPNESLWNVEYIVRQHSRQLGYAVAECKIYPDSDTGTILQLIDSVPDCVGVILMTGCDKLSSERLAALGRLPFPVVALDSAYFYAGELPKNLYTVAADPESCARLWVDVLIRNGHRRIGYLRNEPRTDCTDLHLKALGAALERAGIEFGPDRIFTSTIRSWENSFDSAIQLLRNNIERIRKLRLSALIFTSSGGALVSIKAFRELGLEVPADISVTGGGDRDLYNYLSPGLTVVSADYHAMACLAVELAAGLQKPKTHNLLLPLRLIERESVSCLNQLSIIRKTS